MANESLWEINGNWGTFLVCIKAGKAFIAKIAMPVIFLTFHHKSKNRIWHVTKTQK
jgi:hypothetical protein